MRKVGSKKIKSIIVNELPEFDDHEYVIFINDIESGLRAIVAIHSTTLGPAHGGTRMKYYDKELDALKDVLNLSKAMSYKSALANLPYGGAKGVIILNDDKFNREKILKAYAEKIDDLNGLFQTGTDVGITDTDAMMMSKSSRYILGLPKKDSKDWTASKAAALGVYYSMKAAIKHKYNIDTLEGLTIGVKGVGKLGSYLVELLIIDGAKLIISDVDTKKTNNMVKKFPQINVVDSRTIHQHKMDIYSPCALGNEFNKSKIKELDCIIIAGGANNQLKNESVGTELYKKGIIYVPDYIANAGGLIFVSEDLEVDGFNLSRFESRLMNITSVVANILGDSKKNNLPPDRIADMIALKRIREKTI